MVPKRHKVDLNKADKTILVQIIKVGPQIQLYSHARCASLKRTFGWKLLSCWKRAKAAGLGGF